MSVHYRALFALLLPVLASGQIAWDHNPASRNGPPEWGAITPPYATCGYTPTFSTQFVQVGMKQTPIDIPTGKAVRAILPRPSFRYEDVPLDVENTGHVVEVPYEAGSSVRIGTSPTDKYDLMQFHFHAPSEHTVDGKQYDAELHLVHSNILGELMVVGVFLAKSASAVPGIYDEIVSNAPLTVGSNHVAGKRVNARDLLPRDRGFYTYTGSLTTPPCTESVRWFVLETPVSVTNFVIQQLHTITGMFPGYGGYQNNNRPVLPLNGRPVLVAR